MVKISLSIGIVCMVNNTAILEQAAAGSSKSSSQSIAQTKSNDSGECPAAVAAKGKHNVR
jgi:hypothetical protein